jgi:hypothetical protein
MSQMVERMRAVIRSADRWFPSSRPAASLKRAIAVVSAWRLWMVSTPSRCSLATVVRSACVSRVCWVTACNRFWRYPVASHWGGTMDRAMTANTGSMTKSMTMG